jgi:hypothetical protein
VDSRWSPFVHAAALTAFGPPISRSPLEKTVARSEGEQRTPGLADALEDCHTVAEILLWIKRECDTPETNSPDRNALWTGGKRIPAGTNEYPTHENAVLESIGWSPTTTSRNSDPEPHVWD